MNSNFLYNFNLKSHIRMGIFTVIFTIMFFNAHFTFGTESCLNIFSVERNFKLDNKSELKNGFFKLNDTYLIQIDKDPTLREMKLEKKINKDNKTYLLFTGKWLEREIAYLLTENEITFSKKLKNPNKSETKIPLSNTNFINQLIENVFEASILNRFIFKPYRQLTDLNNSIEIVGNLTSPQEVVTPMLNSLINFDKKMSSMGFLKPDHTRVIISGKSLLPDLMGPFYVQSPIFNIWTKSKEMQIIAMNPIFWNYSTLIDKSVLFHERMHSYLYNTYSIDSYVNGNKIVQEALADFGAAIMTQSPHIGRDLNHNKTPKRDLETRTSSNNSMPSTTINDIGDLMTNFNHENSLLFSNILWKIREIIGQENMEVEFKNIVDNLNYFHNSYVQYLRKEDRLNGKDFQNRIYDLEYFLSVVLRTTKNFTPSSTIKDMIKTAAEDLKLSIHRIETLASILTPVSANKPIKLSPLSSRQILFVTLVGAIEFTLKGSLIYWMFSDDDNDSKVSFAK